MSKTTARIERFYNCIRWVMIDGYCSTASDSDQEFAKELKKYLLEVINSNSTNNFDDVLLACYHIGFYGYSLAWNKSSWRKSSEIVYNYYKAHSLITKIKEYERMYRTKIVHDYLRTLNYFYDCISNKKKIDYWKTPCIGSGIEYVPLDMLDDILSNFEDKYEKESPKKSLSREEKIQIKMYELANVIHHTFNNISYLSKAMESRKIDIHDAGKNASEYSNDGLATLGDTILNSLIADYLYRERKLTNKGELTKAKWKLASNSTLFKLVNGERIIDFAYNEYYFHSDRNMTDDKRVRDGKHDQYVEAIVGAIYLDVGYEKTRKWFKEYLLPKLEKYSKIDY